MHQIVVSCRLGHGTIAAGGYPAVGQPRAGYLDRARALMTRAEALGATLAAWSATTLAFAWDPESIEEAIALATSLSEGAAQSPRAPRAGGSSARAPHAGALGEEDAWACGVAEGEMELVAPSGQRATLAWGEPLVAAVSLARIAKPGEVLLDGDVRAVRVGELMVHGTRVSTDAGKRVRGWRLDIVRPWRRVSSARTAALHTPESAPASVAPRPLPLHDELATTQHNVVPTFVQEHVTIVEAPIVDAPPSETPLTTSAPAVTLEERIRAMARVARTGPGALDALRRARAEADAEELKCQTSLALAVALGLAGRPEEALVEGMDALARARESGDAKATHACFALLSKLYAGAGRVDDAARMRASR